MADKLKELREKQQSLVAQARELLDKAGTDEARASEYETEHDTAMAEYDKLEGQCQRLEKLLGIEERFNERMANKRPKGEDTEARSGGEGTGDEITYRNVFAKVVCGAQPADLEPEERAVLKKGVNKFEQRMQTVGTAAAGGYTVPTELATFIDKALKDWGPMYDQDVCTVINSTSGNAFKIPTLDDTAKSAGAHTEGTALTDDGSEDATFGQKSLDAYVFDTEFIKWSFELNADSIFNMEELLGGLLGERLGRLANAQLTVGSGASAPNGVVTASSLGVTAAGTTAVTYDEIIDLEHSVNAAYRRSPKAAYMLPDLTFKAIRKLKDGQGNYLWQAGDVQKGAPALLNNYRYHINDDMAALTTGNKAMLFGDFSRYYVRKVGSYVIGVLRERFWPDTGIAGLVRFDGELGQAGAIKHLKMA